MHFLCLNRTGGLACPNGPNGFVRQNNFVPRRRINMKQTVLELLLDYLKVFFRLTIFQLFTKTKHHFHVVTQRRIYFLRQGCICFVKIGSTLRVPQNVVVTLILFNICAETSPVNAPFSAACFAPSLLLKNHVLPLPPVPDKSLAILTLTSALEVWFSRHQSKQQ